MSKILEKLKGGDLRSIGESKQVVKDILKNPKLFKEVFEGMLNEDSLIRMRSADVIEKVSSQHPEYLQPFKNRLINEVSGVNQQEVRWHLAQMFSYLKLNKEERERIAKMLLSWTDSEKSNIVKAFSMLTLANFAEQDEKLKAILIKKFEAMMKTGSPAIVSKGRKLLKQLKKCSTK